jgi:alditol oxidase
VRGLSGAVHPVLQVTELRTIAADRLWLSPQYERDTLAIHFTWAPEPQGVARVLVALEEALAPFAARPHWGKLFAAEAPAIAGLYNRLEDFRRLAERLDPRGAFRNDWLEGRVLGAA